jgi:hypothetical protein
MSLKMVVLSDEEGCNECARKIRKEGKRERRIKQKGKGKGRREEGKRGDRNEVIRNTTRNGTRAYFDGSMKIRSPGIVGGDLTLSRSDG